MFQKNNEIHFSKKSGNFHRFLSELIGNSNLRLQLHAFGGRCESFQSKLNRET